MFYFILELQMILLFIVLSNIVYLLFICLFFVCISVGVTNCDLLVDIIHWKITHKGKESTIHLVKSLNYIEYY